MIRFLVLLMLVLVVVVSGSLLLLKDPGYALFSYADVTYEMTLSMLAVIVVVSYAGLYVLYKLLRLTVAFPDRMYVWGHQQRVRRARQSYYRGMRELLSGHWKRAEKLLLRYVDSSDAPLLNYLAAARAAQQQGQHARRDDYLQRAFQTGREAAMATGLTQAALQVDQGQLEQALASLTHLHEKEPRNPHILAMLFTVYQKLGEWDALKRILPDLWKLGIVNDDRAAELETEITMHLLERAALQNDAEVLLQEWQSLPRDIRHIEPVVTLCAEHFARLDRHDEAEKILHEALKLQWNKQLVYQLGKLKTQNPVATLKYAEDWVKDHSQDAILHLSLGRICLNGRLWGKGRIYLEKSLELSERAETRFELGALLEHLGDQDAAMLHFKQGLSQVVDEFGSHLTELEGLEDEEDIKATAEEQH